MTSETARPAGEDDVVRLAHAMFDRAEALDPAGAAALFSDDAVFEFPFAPEGFPARHEGREALAAFFAQFPKYYRRIRLLDRQMTPLADGSGVVAEYRGEWETVKGHPYHNTYIALFRMRDGKSQHVREFFNPLVWLESLGRTSSTAAAG